MQMWLNMNAMLHGVHAKYMVAYLMHVLCAYMALRSLDCAHVVSNTMICTQCIDDMN